MDDLGLTSRGGLYPKIHIIYLVGDLVGACPLPSKLVGLPYPFGWAIQP